MNDNIEQKKVEAPECKTPAYTPPPGVAIVLGQLDNHGPVHLSPKKANE